VNNLAAVLHYQADRQDAAEIAVERQPAVLLVRAFSYFLVNTLRGVGLFWREGFDVYKNPPHYLLALPSHKAVVLQVARHTTPATTGAHHTATSDLRVYIFLAEW